MKIRQQRGFTLIEVIVVAGIIAVLAGILVPIIFKEIDESRIARASADIRAISSAMVVFRKDTSQWPITENCQKSTTALSGLGAEPAITGSGWSLAGRDVYDNYLGRDDNGCWPTTWKGPYMAVVNPDPWGRMYITNADAFLSLTNTPVWIISAGPNGTIETAATAMSIDTANSDDVGIRIR